MKWSELSKKQRKWLIIIGVLVALSIIGSLAPTTQISTPKEPEYTEYNEMKDVAKFYADRVLEQQLKYPDGWSYESEQLDRIDSTTYKMTAIVLAKNGFGVRSRLYYNFKIRYIGNMRDSYGGYEKRYESSNWKILTNEIAE